MKSTYRKPFARAVFSTAIVAAGVALAAPAAAGITFYSSEDLGGQSFSTARDVRDLERNGLGRRVLSFEVDGRPLADLR